MLLGDIMTSSSQSRSDKSVSWIRRVIIYFIVLFIGFLIGFVPMWFRSRDSDRRLAEATSQADQAQTQDTLAAAEAARQLELARMQNMLASAAIDAQRGDYEAARQSTSSFFTSLREEANKGADSSLSQAQKDAVEPLFARRDETISLLARNDPAATDRLSDLYVLFRELMDQ
jgi:hypothetical protein